MDSGSPGGRAGQNLEGCSVPKSVGPAEPGGIVGKAGQVGVIYNHDRAVDGRLESRIHYHVGAELFGAPISPRSEVHTDSLDVGKGDSRAYVERRDARWGRRG